MRLRRINHDFKGRGILWCGPAALAAVTGMPTSWAQAVLIKDPKAYKDFDVWTGGVYHEILSRACCACGTPVMFHDQKGYVKDVKKFSICLVPGHYIVVENGWMVDTGNQEPTRIEDTRFRYEKYSCYYEVLDERGQQGINCFKAK